MIRMSHAVLTAGIALVCTMLAHPARNDDEVDQPKIKSKNQGVLMTTKDEKIYRNIMPKVSDKTLQGIFEDPDTIYYTDTEIPKAYQDFEGALQGVHDPIYNISAVKSEPFGNTNREFPWGTPFGTHNSPASKSFRFISLPSQKDGKRWPIVWWRAELMKDNRVIDQATSGYAWVFPEGTTVGEVLYHNDSKGYSHVYEVRIRKRQLTKWTINVYRPFPTAKDLSKAIKTTWADYNDDAGLVALTTQLDSTATGSLYTLASNHPDFVSFKQSRKIDVLPAISEKHVIKLLDETTFTSALGADWKNGKDAPHAPTTKADFHIIPKDYSGGFVEVDSKSCMQCHETCNKPARDFDFKRDWYGRVRGSDGIFSFHPFSHGSISPRGTPHAISINQDMVNKGIVAAYNEKLHPDTVYRRIKDLN